MIKLVWYEQAEREAELNELKDVYKTIEADCGRNARMQQERLIRFGKLQLEEEQHKKRVAERNALLVNVARRYGGAKFASLSLNPDHPLGSPSQTCVTCSLSNKHCIYLCRQLPNCQSSGRVEECSGRAKGERE